MPNCKCKQSNKSSIMKKVLDKENINFTVIKNGEQNSNVSS